MGSTSVIDNCPDGLDCPNYDECSENKSPDEPCPLAERYYDNQVPIDKIISDAYLN